MNPLALGIHKHKQLSIFFSLIPVLQLCLFRAVNQPYMGRFSGPSRRAPSEPNIRGAAKHGQLASPWGSATWSASSAAPSSPTLPTPPSSVSNHPHATAPADYLWISPLLAPLGSDPLPRFCVRVRVRALGRGAGMGFRSGRLRDWFVGVLGGSPG
jgi:hypothetical protein